MAHAIQDRTNEFRSIIALQRKQLKNAKVGAQRALLSDTQQNAANNGPPKRSEFARRAAEIGRGIGGTMEKLYVLPWV